MNYKEAMKACIDGKLIQAIREGSIPCLIKFDGYKFKFRRYNEDIYQGNFSFLELYRYSIYDPNKENIEKCTKILEKFVSSPSLFESTDTHLYFDTRSYGLLVSDIVELRLKLKIDTDFEFHAIRGSVDTDYISISLTIKDK